MATKPSNTRQSAGFLVSHAALGALTELAGELHWPPSASSQRRKRVQSRHRQMPGTVEKTVARDVAGLGVLGEGVQRLALEGPLLGAVIAGDDGIAVAGGVAGLGLQRRPVRRTRTVAGRFAVHVLVESIARHALGVGEDVALVGLGGFGRRVRG